jgi:CheY-like chemotaxis protein
MAWILVADDDSPTRETIRFVLEDAGYHVLEASDGRQALAILTSATQALVALVDLLMPGMDGLDLLRSIVADPRLAARHRYIGMTAAVGAVTPLADTLLAQLHGSLMEKPFGMDTLLDTVAAACASLGVQTTPQGAPIPRAPSQE